MLLSVLDRLCLMAVLPKEGDIITLKILRDLTSALGFTEEEVEKFGLKSVDGKTVWAADAPEVEIKVGSKALSIIVTAYEKLSAQKKLTIEHLQTFEKFVTD